MSQADFIVYRWNKSSKSGRHRTCSGQLESSVRMNEMRQRPKATSYPPRGGPRAHSAPADNLIKNKRKGPI